MHVRTLARIAGKDAKVGCTFNRRCIGCRKIGLRQRRRFHHQRPFEPGDIRRASFDVNDNPAGAIAYPTVQVECARDAVDEGPKANTLRPPADDDTPRSDTSRAINIALVPVHPLSV